MARKIVAEKTQEEKDQEMKDKVVGILQAGFEAGKDEDTIKMEMCNAGIPFGKVEGMYMAVAIELGFVIDPKVLQTAIESQVKGTDWEVCDTWEQVEKFVEGILEEVEGATRQKVLSMAKKHCKESEIKLPEEAKAAKATRAKGGKVADAVVSAFGKNTKCTKDELYDAILPTVKGPDNAEYYVNQYHTLGWALSNGVSLVDASAATKSMVLTRNQTKKVEEPEVEEETDGTKE